MKNQVSLFSSTFFHLENTNEKSSFTLFIHLFSYRKHKYIQIIISKKRGTKNVKLKKKLPGLEWSQIIHLISSYHFIPSHKVQNQNMTKKTSKVYIWVNHKRAHEKITWFSISILRSKMIRRTKLRTISIILSYVFAMKNLLLKNFNFFTSSSWAKFQKHDKIVSKIVQKMLKKLKLFLPASDNRFPSS